MIGKDEAALQFEDPATREEIRFISSRHLDLSAPKTLFIKYVSGIRDYYDVLSIAYSAKVGVVPLMVKMLLLEDLAQARIREVTIRQQDTTYQRAQGSSPVLHGFITQGEKRGKEVASIFLMDAVGKAELQIVLSGPIAMDEKMVRGIVTSVHMLPRK
jgi:hypothetical protein